MKRMVIVCAIHDRQIVLIRKNRPKFQIDKLNFPGGSVKDGESTYDAAKRELKEETNLKLAPFHIVGKFGNNKDWEVFIYVGKIINFNELKQLTDEQIEVYSISQIITHPDLIDNLRYIIPKCLSKIDNFTEINI